VIDVRIEELVVVGLDVDRDAFGPAVEAALAARLEGASFTADPLVEQVAGELHDAISERLP
jgi:hypothetical protein